MDILKLVWNYKYLENKIWINKQKENFSFKFDIDLNNDCDPNPCNNDGECFDGTFSFTCNCANGYTGLTCEESKLNQSYERRDLTDRFYY